MSELQEKYPNNRLRRTRQSQWIRNLVSENSLSTNDLIWPIFICEGSNVKDEIESMPGVYRYSVDRLNEVVDQALLNKISLIALFPYTPKDKKDLELAIKLDVDWIALSFIQTTKDLLTAKKLIPSKFKVMVKVEKPSAMDEIESITENSDGIMVARGDLGVETNPEDVPIHQRTMVAACRKFGKPCIVATQMLESMIDSPTPTRAEASDVATAIFQGVDAVMLSAESAAGNYPKEAVEMMDKIIKRVECDPKYLSNIQNYNLDHIKTSTEAIATAALEVAGIAECQCIATFSGTGRSILRVARMRPDVTLIGLTTNKKVARQNVLTWGTFMDVVDKISSSTEMVDRACRVAKSRKILKNGDKIIITAGVPFGKVGTTNTLRIAKIIADSKLT